MSQERTCSKCGETVISNSTAQPFVCNFVCGGMTSEIDSLKHDWRPADENDRLKAIAAWSDEGNAGSDSYEERALAGAAFYNARKQEIDALNAQADENDRRYWAAAVKGVAPWALTAAVTPPLSTRTCQTCSKTCDVGVACWWCGNA